MPLTPRPPRGPFSRSFKQLANVPSMDELARVLKQRFPELFATIQSRSLSGKLAKLESGEGAWWRNRADQLGALAQVLGIDAGDLSALPPRAADAAWRIAEFPSLAPIDFRAETPPLFGRITRRGGGAEKDHLWLSLALGHSDEHAWVRDAQPPRGLAWLRVPAGCGRGLLTRVLAARPQFRVAVADTLPDAIAGAQGLNPLVLSIRERCSEADLQSLAALDPNRPVLVLSPHAHPSQPSDDAHSKASQGGTPDDLHKTSTPRHPLLANWRSLEWRLKTEWRQELLRWVETRLRGPSDTLFSAEGAWRWVHAFDPEGVVFSTPADLLSLARLIHEVGERRLPKPTAPQAGSHLVEALGTRDSWEIHQVKRLVALRWRFGPGNWLDPLPWGEWERVLRGGNEPGPSLSPGKRVKRVEKPDGMLTADELRQRGLLERNEQGAYGFAQPASATLLLQDQLAEWVRAGDVDAWAAPTLQHVTRWNLALHVLRGLSSKDWKRSAELASPKSRWDPSAMAAEELLMLAVGLHYLLVPASVHEPALSQIMERCGERWRVAGFRFGQSLVGPPRDEQTSHRWVLACWGWSLKAPSLADMTPDELRHFPGWAREPTAWIDQLPLMCLPHDVEPSYEPRHAPTSDVVLLRELIDGVSMMTRRLGLPSLRTGAVKPSIASAIALTFAADGTLPADPRDWLELARRPWVHRPLMAALSGRRTPVVERLIPSFAQVSAGVETAFAANELVWDPLWTYLADEDALLGVLSTLTPVECWGLARLIQHLPAAARLPILLALDNGMFMREAGYLIRVSGVRDEALFSRFMSYFAVSLHGAALWECMPDLCLARLSALGTPVEDVLAHHCPNPLVPTLVDIFMAAPSTFLHPEEAIQWAVPRLNAGGQAAIAAARLLQALERNAAGLA